MPLIHGKKDPNTGTYPIQSKRLHELISGFGGTLRLVAFPGAGHGYSARESVLHTQAEMIEWFDRYVKGASAVEASAPVKAR